MPPRTSRVSAGYRRRCVGRVALPLGLPLLGALLLLGSCALPPPPGAFFEWSVVRPIEFPADRPLVAIDVRWQDFLPDTTPVAGDCGLDACLADQPAWAERCVKPRAEQTALATMARLVPARAGVPPGWSMLARPADVGEFGLTTAPVAPACSPTWLSTAAAAAVVRAMVVQAGGAAPPDCGVLRTTLGLAVLVLDRERQSLGDFIVHDMPAIFGSTLGAFASLGTVTALSDLVHRVVVLTLTVEREGAAPVQLSARGAAGISVGSLKMVENTTAAPPELVSVAFIEALRQLDAALAADAARHCRAAAR